MRPWTTPAAIGGLLLVTAVTAFSARPGPMDAPPALAIPDTAQVIQLIVGDTMRVALRVAAPVRVVRATGMANAAIGAAAFTSLQPATVAVSGGNLLTANDTGRATIKGTSNDDDAVAATIMVHVVTRRQATNIMAAEVCPNHDVNDFVAQEPLSEGVHAIHEFHDCQKLIHNNAYSALAGIFAHGNVARYERWRDYERGRLAAIIVNWGTGRDTLSYRPLGLGPGVSCLYLQASSDTTWSAALIRQRAPVLGANRTKRFTSCNESLAWASITDKAKAMLVVRRYKGVDMKGDPIAPPVARWDWDSERRINYMGVKCGPDAWCEIGPRGFTPSVPLAYAGTRPLRRPLEGRSIIKGYYDQQYLADSTAQRPSSVFGTITPGVDAHSITQMDHAQRRWYHVAQIELQEMRWSVTKDYNRYVRNYAGMPVGQTAPAKRTTVEYELEPINPPTHVALGMYGGRLNGIAMRPRSVYHRTHSHHDANMQMPTTRWRWKGDDEGTWTYCKPDGCCENVDVLVQ